jgi:hypothetical protein
MEITWRKTTSKEFSLIQNKKMQTELLDYLGNDDFYILGIVNHDGIEKIVINLSGYREHLENLDIPYLSYYDEDQKMTVWYPDNEKIKTVFYYVESIFENNGFKVSKVESTCLDLGDFSINIRVEVLL